MCRNIRKLRRSSGLPTDNELHDAALQFIRKISGYRAPSRSNRAAFDRAVRGVARVSQTLFQDLETRPARNRSHPAVRSRRAGGS